MKSQDNPLPRDTDSRPDVVHGVLMAGLRYNPFAEFMVRAPGKPWTRVLPASPENPAALSSKVFQVP